MVSRTLTTRRVERLERKPFQVSELIGPLAKEEPIYSGLDQSVRGWYQATVPACKVEGEGGDAGGKDAGKKDGGKKKK